jgi:hypothetical protein
LELGSEVVLLHGQLLHVLRNVGKAGGEVVEKSYRLLLGLLRIFFLADFTGTYSPNQ